MTRSSLRGLILTTHVMSNVLLQLDVLFESEYWWWFLLNAETRYA